MMVSDTDDLWVFGYGSLLWNPGFPVAETRVARLRGWHRSFCMSSIHHRGTPERPGLVLALDLAEGAHCDGLGFRVEARYAAQTIDYLRERELISSAYLETRQSRGPRTAARGRRMC
jgi:cation transport protein ChaC